MLINLLIILLINNHIYINKISQHFNKTKIFILTTNCNKSKNTHNKPLKYLNLHSTLNIQNISLI